MSMAMKYNMKRKAKKTNHYDDGGDVEVASPSFPATPTFGSDAGAEALGGGKKGGGGGGIMSMLPMLAALAEGGEATNKKHRAVKAFHGAMGVHDDRAKYGGHKGVSDAGQLVRENGEDDVGYAKDMHKRKLHEIKSMPKPDLMAEGGEATPRPHEKGVHADLGQYGSGKSGSSMAGEMVREGSKGRMEEAKAKHAHKLKELRSMKKPQLMAEGGEMTDEGRVERIMKKRQMMSEGGMIANDEGEGASADHDPNEFDDLVLDDHLSMHETGANSGDELGNAQEEHDQHDIVSRIMKSRAKKDRNPRPA